VVDDGSSINTKKLLEPFKNKIRYYYKENGGVNTARLLGLGKAKGRYIALIDQDDIWPSEKLQKQVEFLDAYPNLDFIFGDWHNFNENGFYPKTDLNSRKIFRSIPTEKVTNVNSAAYIFPNSLHYDYLSDGLFLIQGTFMGKKSMCEKYEMFKTKTNGREFYEFGVRTLHLLKVGYIDEVLLHRRMHGNNVALKSELWQKNTITICTEALNYSWMDDKCRFQLKKALERAYLNLGTIYVNNGNFAEARKNLKHIFKLNKFRADATLFYFLTFTKSPKIISAAKSIRKAFA
jgi:glycosyltransferase involved in cell wall biosynthesis